MIPINLAVEDDLSAAVLRRILSSCGQDYAIGSVYQRHGFGFLKKNVKGFNNSAKGTPFVLLTDLDSYECPLALISSWLSTSRHPNFMFRVAVREVEAWLLADRRGIARYLEININRVPENPEAVIKPKRELIRLAAQSRNRSLRLDIIPKSGSTSQIGPDYNGRLRVFVERHWNVDQAELSSSSLRRAMRALRKFKPCWVKK